MTHAEILTKAIEKAIGNGWQPEWLGDLDYYTLVAGEDSINLVQTRNTLTREGIYNHFGTLDVNTLIFDHDFAKALWPNDGFEQISVKSTKGGPLRSSRNSFLTKPARAFKDSWQYHLQQMVIAGDPIAYLGEHL